MDPFRGPVLSPLPSPFLDLRSISSRLHWFLSLHLPPAVVPMRGIKCSALIFVDDETRQIPIDPVYRPVVTLN